ncbi:hypothetical protein DdX_21850 [Ditylenchus destructor]|uniref:Uncharacterized protein n=1 Tax=Ditylenchus destructor TaxID=166010 RepID=A0AAD4QR73_9BILA|nr:hypothetical protein DdX_21850 [Ditylenchus destructor]
MVRAIFFSILFAFGHVGHTNIVTYYVYMEACQGRFCYAVRGINISYNTENQEVTLLCTAPAPLDEEETLPRAVAKGANAYETETPNRLVYAADLPCNDTTPLLLEFISGESHFIAVSVVYHDFYDKQSSLVVPQETTLNSMLINLQPNGSVTVITIMGSSPKKANVTFNETMYQCSVFEDVYKRACFCKDNYAREFCLRHDYRELDPSRTEYELPLLYRNPEATSRFHYVKVKTDLQLNLNTILKEKNYLQIQVSQNINV